MRPRHTGNKFKLKKKLKTSERAYGAVWDAHGNSHFTGDASKLSDKNLNSNKN